MLRQPLGPAQARISTGIDEVGINDAIVGASFGASGDRQMWRTAAPSASTS
jgi:hypothetical protein